VEFVSGGYLSPPCRIKGISLAFHEIIFQNAAQATGVGYFL